jgi:hypothetical protein
MSCTYEVLFVRLDVVEWGGGLKFGLAGWAFSDGGERTGEDICGMFFAERTGEENSNW